MRAVFSYKKEKEQTICTLQRLIDTMKERSITTGEEHNLRLAMTCVMAAPVEDPQDTHYKNEGYS